MQHIPFKLIKICLLSVIMLCSAEAVWSQKLTAAGVANRNSTQNPALYDITEKIKNFENPKNVLGNPYLIDKWKKGEIKDIKGVRYKDLELKFNLNSGQLIFKDPVTGDSIVIKKQMIKEFKINEGNDSTTVFRNFDDRNKKNSNHGFCQVVYDKGKSQLLNQHSKVIIGQDTGSPANNSSTISGSYRLVENLYLMEIDLNFCKLRNNLKGFLKCFEGYEMEIKSFIKKKDLNIKNKDHVIMIVAYYDTLY